MRRLSWTCCLAVGALGRPHVHVDKLTGSSMASHQHPPYAYRPFEDFLLHSTNHTVRPSDVAVAVSGHDGMLKWQQEQGRWIVVDSRLGQKFFTLFDTILYTDSIDAEVSVLHRTNGPMRARMCCGEANKTLGRTISGAQYKREHVLPRFLAQFPARKWYVITEEDVWWSGPRLLALLSAADRAVAKEAAKRGVEPSQVPALVSGGPDGSIDGPFLIVNRLLLAQLAGAEPGASSSPRTRGLSHCRHALLRCITSRSFRKKNQRMCHFAERDHKFVKAASTSTAAAITTTTTTPTTTTTTAATAFDATPNTTTTSNWDKAGSGALYNWGHLVSFCALHFRDQLSKDRVLALVSMDYLEPSGGGFPNFIQNGNSWRQARSLQLGFLERIPEFYQCCLRCERRVKITTEAHAKHALVQALRSLVSWHHATSKDVRFLDAITGGKPQPEAMARAVHMVLPSSARERRGSSSSSSSSSSCDWGRQGWLSLEGGKPYGTGWHTAFLALPESARNNSQITRAAVSKNALVLRHASDAMKNDRAVVLEAVKQNGMALQHASADLRNDREVVLVAVKQSGAALLHASGGLRADREVVLEAVQRFGRALRFAPAELQSDRGIVLQAVRQDGGAIKHASDELKNDREVVVGAVAQNGFALEHASDELRGDREVVQEAIKQNWRALHLATNSLRGDREIALFAIRQCGQSDRCALPHVLAAFAPGLRKDRGVVEAAVSLDWRALKFASGELKGDREVVLVALRQCSQLAVRCDQRQFFARIPVQLRKDKGLADAAAAFFGAGAG